MHTFKPSKVYTQKSSRLFPGPEGYGLLSTTPDLGLDLLGLAELAQVDSRPLLAVDQRAQVLEDHVGVGVPALIPSPVTPLTHY